MKPVKLENFKVKSSIARRIAAAKWGQVGSSISTNTPGVYYYSCSSHGGYVTDAKNLPESFKERLKKSVPSFLKPDMLALFVQHQPGGTVVLKTSTATLAKTHRTASANVPATPGRCEWIEYPVYTFEEDCSWAVLEHFTDIKPDPEAFSCDQTGRADHVAKTVRNWYPELLENA